MSDPTDSRTTDTPFNACDWLEIGLLLNLYDHNPSRALCEKANELLARFRREGKIANG